MLGIQKNIATEFLRCLNIIEHIYNKIKNIKKYRKFTEDSTETYVAGGFYSYVHRQLTC